MERITTQETNKKIGRLSWIIGGILYLILLVLVASGAVIWHIYRDALQNAPVGVLVGQVSVGPTCAVEEEGIPCITPPETVTSREVVVYKASALKREVARMNLNAFGEYRFELTPGSYTVDIGENGIDTAKELPANVTIESGKVTTLNFSIDTGVR